MARRLDAVDGLRGLAAVAVLAFHVYHSVAPGWESLRDVPYPVHRTLGHLGAYAVLLFFVLSGLLVGLPFVRSAIDDRPVDLARYARTRLGRIFPLWWVVLALTLAIGFPAVLAQPLHLALLASLQQSYDPDLVRRYLPHGWSLVIEVSFYAALPLAFLATRAAARRLPRRRRPLVVLASCLLAIAAAQAFKHVELYTRPVPHPDHRWQVLSLPAYADAFALGGLVALALVALPAALRGPLGAACLAASVPVWLVGLDDPRRVADQDWMAWSFALLAAGCVLWQAGPVARLLGVRPLRALGTYTYGIYLWHLPLLYLLLGVGVLHRNRPGEAPLALAVVLAGAIGLATLSFHLLEEPVLRRAREGWRASPRVVPAPAAGD